MDTEYSTKVIHYNKFYDLARSHLLRNLFAEHDNARMTQRGHRKGGPGRLWTSNILSRSDLRLATAVQKVRDRRMDQGGPYAVVNGDDDDDEDEQFS